MSDIHIRRTTGFLSCLIAVLFIILVVLVVKLVIPAAPPEHVEYIPPVWPGGIKPEKVVDKTAPVQGTEPWEVNYRIPTDTLPLHYDLYLHPDLDTGLFNGRVTIHVSVTAASKSFLVVHFKEMNITSTKLKKEGEMVELKDYFQYEPNQFWVVRPKQNLRQGNYTMELEFNGSLENRITGFYKSVYTSVDGEKRSIATSKFQPTDARGAFPCFDEPSFKSTFTVTLVRPSEGYIALSNMPEQSQTVHSPRRGLTEVLFQKSVPMVTYLACFIVCDFQHVETRTQDNKLFRVYSTPEQVSRTHYARDIGVDILNYFENYFEVPYPLPKQDQIAIPDFVSGAMEHWGLITYRETNLLYDDQGSSSYNKQRVATVISHELAHMWFGNLVTLKWWDDLWLNEGFASYIEYKGVNQHETDWDMLDQFVVMDLQPVLRLDSQLTSHPIIQPVAHPDQITEIFDAISYSKGASVLRMLDNFMGEEDFRIGIRNFLRDFKFGNAITSDLWHHLAATSSDKLDILEIMGTWTKQMGYPVLDVKRIGPNRLEVRQKRFLEDPTAVSADDSPYNYVWDVPVTYRTPVINREQRWLYRTMESLEITLPANTEWVKLNVDQYGFYRVNYDPSLWEDLIKLLMLSHENLSPPDRSSLLDDAFSLAAASQLSYTVPLRLASYLAKESHYIPWKTVVSHLSKLGRLLRPTKAYPYYREYVLRLVGEHARKMGWDDKGTHLQRMLRPLLLSLACSSGDKAHLATATSKLRQWLANDTATAIPPNLRTLVYEYGLKDADYKDWEMMLHRYTNEVNAQEKAKQFVGLTSTSTPWIMHRFLDVSQNTSIVRTQNYFRGLIYAARNPMATSMVWEFIKSNWEILVSRFTINNRYLGRTVKSVVGRFTTEEQLNDAKAFFARYPEAGAGTRARLQALEVVNKNIGWLREHSDTLHDWLKESLTSE